MCYKGLVCVVNHIGWGCWCFCCFIFKGDIALIMLLPTKCCTDTVSEFSKSSWWWLYRLICMHPGLCLMFAALSSKNSSLYLIMTIILNSLGQFSKSLNVELSLLLWYMSSDVPFHWIVPEEFHFHLWPSLVCTHTYETFLCFCVASRLTFVACPPGFLE